MIFNSKSAAQAQDLSPLTNIIHTKSRQDMVPQVLRYSFNTVPVYDNRDIMHPSKSFSI